MGKLTIQEQKIDLAESITAYIVKSFTNMPLWVEDENGDSYYYDGAQDIFNNVLELVEMEIK